MHLRKNNVEGPMGISIVVPVYNKEKYISRILGDISNQSFEDFECIIVDDGSTDSSGESALQEQVGNMLPS